MSRTDRSAIFRPSGELGFQFFAKTVSVSHAFVHLVDFGQPVTVGGLRVESGDIVYGDRHGVLTIPPAIVADIPARRGAHAGAGATCRRRCASRRTFRSTTSNMW